MRPVTARLVMFTPTGHCAPTVLTYHPARPLEVHIQTLIPVEGLQEWVRSRTWLGAAVSGPVISLDLALPDGRRIVLSGPSVPVRDFLNASYDACPPCDGCADPFCLCCAALGRQVNTALAGLFETEGA